MAEKDKDEQELVTLAADLKKAAEEVNRKTDEVKKIAEQALNESQNVGKMTVETKTAFDTLFTDRNQDAEKLAGLTARFDDLEQKQARRGVDETEREKSIGEQVIENELVKAANATWRGNIKVSVQRKDIMSVTGTWGSVTSPANSLTPSMRVPGIIGLPERRMTVRDLLAPGQTGTNSIEYARENVFTNLAGVVSEGAVKPQSNITFELATAPVRTIAHYFKASRQILDDAPALRSYIDARARYGLMLAEEAELLNGDGTGQHIHGLIPQATAYSAAFTPALATLIDTLRLAALQVMLAEFPPTGIVLNPIDWVKVQLTKDTTGRYIIGNPADSLTPRLWSLPVVETQAMTEDKFLVGNFNMAAQIFDRLAMEILLSTENEDDFIRNLISIRCEERLALAVYRPLALVYGDAGNVT